MTADRRDRRRKVLKARAAPIVRTGPSPDDQHEIVFFRRHKNDDPNQSVPGREALNSSPVGVRAKMRAALVALPQHRRSDSPGVTIGRR